MATWTPPVCAGSIQGYYFYRKPAGATFYSSFLTTNPSFTSTGLTANTTYNYYARGFYTCGNGVVWTQSTPVQSVTTLMRLGEEDDSQLESDISIYPNPSNGLVTVEMPESTEPVIVEAFNALGQSVELRSTSDNNMLTLAFNATDPNGMYWLRIRSGSAVSNHQIALLR